MTSRKVRCTILHSPGPTPTSVPGLEPHRRTGYKARRITERPSSSPVPSSNAPARRLKWRAAGIDEPSLALGGVDRASSVAVASGERACSLVASVFPCSSCFEAFEPLLTPGAGGTRAENKPTYLTASDRKLASDPCITGALEA
jgi:hypothetical protein